MRKNIVIAVLCMVALTARADVWPFRAEAQQQDTLLQMLASFATYMKNDYQPCREPNDAGERCGAFRSHSTMQSNEDGVRTNADMSMVCAFLSRYARGRVELPSGVSWADIDSMAMASLVFAYSTHKANRLKVTADGRHWGSTSATDHVWESSLWAMSVAFSAFFQWDALGESQRQCVYRLLKAECDYELQRDIPTGYEGDTKAEENGWEACVLAATLGLFPDDPMAPRWFDRLRRFAINSYSCHADATDTTVVDPTFDRQRVCDLYVGANLFDDMTLQNHDYFHTSYQNVVIQELGEAALALALFQQRTKPDGRQWHTRALMHNNRRVMDEVLLWLALSDGELAMPNSNDWSLFLYDQLTSYTTMACFLRHSDALLLENRACEMIRRRQLSTPDGSWLLRSDIGPRRMGVQAHRVMMTWLMHHLLTTADMVPSTWDDLRRRHAEARLIESQGIVRASTADRFTCFGWSRGLHSYTGWMAPHESGANNLVVPYKAHNTGNFIGWYELSGRRTNAVPAAEPVIKTDGEAWLLNGHLIVNDSALDHRFAIYSSPGRPVVYLDYVQALDSATIIYEKGGLLAINADSLAHFDELGVWSSKPGMTFGDTIDNKSVLTVPHYALYGNHRRKVEPGQTVDRRAVVWSVGRRPSHAPRATQIDTPKGWNGVVVDDDACYVVLSHFDGADTLCTVTGVMATGGKPVFGVPTTIDADGSSATFAVGAGASVAQRVDVFVDGSGIEATADDHSITMSNRLPRRNRLRLTDGRKVRTVRLRPNATVMMSR